MKKSVLSAILNAAGQLGAAYLDKSRRDKAKEEGKQARDLFFENVYAKRPLTGPVRPGESNEVKTDEVNWRAVANYLDSPDENKEYVVKSLLSQAEKERDERLSSERERRKAEEATRREEQKAGDVFKKQYALNALKNIEFPDLTETDTTFGPLPAGVPREKLIKSGTQRKLEKIYELGDPSKPAPSADEVSEYLEGAKKVEKPVRHEMKIDQNTGRAWLLNPYTQELTPLEADGEQFAPGRVRTGGRGQSIGKIPWE